MTTPWRTYLPRRSPEEDLALLAAGYETGWWDDNGVPAPTPTDFFDPNSGWRPTGSEETPPTPQPEQPLF